MIESTSVEIINKNDKNMVADCIYKHPKETVFNFLDNYLFPLLQKFSYESKQIVIVGDFNINVLNYNRKKKKTENFLDTMFQCFPILIYLLIRHLLE